MKRKLLIKMSIFTIIFIIVFFFLNNRLRYKWESREHILESREHIMSLPKDSVDVLFMGASGIYAGISPINLWHEYGFTSFNLATSVQPPLITYYTLLEMLEYQKPELIVIDFASLFVNNNPNVDSMEPYYRKGVESIQSPQLKKKVILDINKEFEGQSMLSYFIPFFRYHDRWNDLKEKDFIYENTYEPYTLGGLLNEKVESVKFGEDFMNPEDEKLPNYEISEKYYVKLIDLANENDINILAITPPRVNYAYGKHLATKEFCEENGITLIDYNVEENFKQLELDLDQDFYNAAHLNAYGNKKLTKHIGKYIVDHYSITDKRNHEGFEYWDQLYLDYIGQH